MITPNGIDQERFKDIPMKEPDDEYINIGAVLRVTPIKDVKTMIMAFGYAKNNNPKLKLWIMGPTDEDEDYAKEWAPIAEEYWKDHKHPHPKYENYAPKRMEELGLHNEE